MSKKERSRMTTLCYLEKDDSYLMLHRIKKENDVNKDKWIGVGGHAEAYESPEDCLMREVWEETGLTLKDYRFRGLITFALKGGETEYMCLYTAADWEGMLTENCSEGDLCWVKKTEIENLNLWTGDRVFFKLLQEERSFFSLKLFYDDDRLIECVLDGKAINWEAFI